MAWQIPVMVLLEISKESETEGISMSDIQHLLSIDDLEDDLRSILEWAIHFKQDPETDYDFKPQHRPLTVTVLILTVILLSTKLVNIPFFRRIALLLHSEF